MEKASYHSHNIVRVIKSRRLRWAGHVARMEDDRSVFKISTDKSAGKRPLGSPRLRWEEIHVIILSNTFIFSTSF